ncbi:MAG: glycosyltransferase [Sphingomonas sp.]|nr:glycosyltransferase [Sphingomonas sp.]
MPIEPREAASNVEAPAKIAVFVADFSATGVVVNALAIAGELLRRGADVRFVATRAEGTLRSSLPPGVVVTQLLPSGGRPPRRKRLRQSILAYRRFLQSFAPGVLFSAGNHGHSTTVIAAAGRRGLRVVVRISNELEHGSPGARRGFVARQLRHFKFRRIAGAADRIVFVSQLLLRSWATIGATGGAKARVIPNGVDVEAVRRKAAEPCHHPWLTAGEVPVVLGVGRLVEQKNFGTLIRAVALASRSRPLRLLLIGDGPLGASLLAQAAAAGLDDSFQIIPPVANLMPYLASAAVVALPSWWEGASNVLLEAIACGTAVVASRTAGSAEELLQGGTYGLLVDPADAADIGHALLKQVGRAPVLPGDRALRFSRQAALNAYAELLIEEARSAA